VRDEIRSTLDKALGDQYSIIRLLGRGGMGAVYLAQDMVLDRTVAIKVLPPEVATPIGKERFRREAQTAAKLNHPNIVPLHAFGEVDDMLYLVMNFVRGGSLSDVLRTQGRLPANTVREILVAIVDALDYAHRQGVIHRDIKPDNILIDEETGRPMLTDFGIAKGGASGSTLTALGMPLGTPFYMSPEQASGEVGIDGRSDLYSLGITSYQLLSGKLPFSEGLPQDILAQHVTKKPPPLKKLAPNVPEDLATSVMRCLAKAPHERWRDAGQLRNALQHGHAGLVEKRTWFDGLLLGRIAPTAWIVMVMMSLASATNTGPTAEPLEFYGLDHFLVPVTVIGPLILFALLALPILGLVLAQVKRAGWSWTYVVRMLLRQPGWWRGWYPAPLRHPATADIWKRLPLGHKFLYTAFDVTLFVILFTILPATALLVAATPEALEAYPSLYWPFIGEILSSSPGARGMDESLALWLCVFAYVGALVWAKRRGLSLGEAHYVASARALAPTHEALTFWKRPHVSVILAAAQTSSSETQSVPQTPKQHVEQIKRAVSAESERLGDLAGRIVSTVDSLVEQIRELDDEIESLERNADSEQMAKLLGKLDGVTAADLNSDTDQQMHELLSSQFQLLKRVADQLEAATKQRSTQMALLTALWREMDGLQGNSANNAGDIDTILEKIRSLCGEIERAENSTIASDRTARPAEST